MEGKLSEQDAVKERTRFKAGRMHQGGGHWHVRVRSTVIVCGECEAHIPKNSRPRSCPECGAGGAGRR